MSRFQFSLRALFLAILLIGMGLFTLGCIPLVVAIGQWTVLSLAAVYQLFLTAAGILFGGALALLLKRPKTCFAAGVCAVSVGGWAWAAVWVVLYFRM